MDGMDVTILFFKIWSTGVLEYCQSIVSYHRLMSFPYNHGW